MLISVVLIHGYYVFRLLHLVVHCRLYTLISLHLWLLFVVSYTGRRRV